MTDPLTGKALVEKSYEYVNRLTRECAKSILDEFNASHAKFKPDGIVPGVSSSIIKWFQKRDSQIMLSFDSTSSSKSQTGVFYLKFKGTTKDAEFGFTGALSTFTAPGGSDSFVKSLTFAVDKANFTRRKF